MNNLRKLIREKGHKVTPARIVILDIFTKGKEPLDASFIYKKIKNKIKNINEATVYRTLTFFEAAGILKKVDLRKNSIYFELADKHHHHIVCTKCDTVEDFENTAIEKIINTIVEKSSAFKKIKDHSLELFGLCQKCS